MTILALSPAFIEMLMPIAIGAIILGIIFGLIEMCMPGFGIFGTIGVFLCVAGVILHMAVGGNLLISIIILFAVSLFFTILVLVLGKSAQSGRLAKTALVSTETAVSQGRTEGTPDFSSYVGKTGITLTDLRPVGKAEIEGDIIEVVSLGSTMIHKGETIVVSFVEGGKVQVSIAE